MDAEISLPKLQEDIHQTFKLWHANNSQDNPLAYLKLFQDISPGNAGDTRQAINDILLDTLDALAVDHEPEANLLHTHFVDGLVMVVAAKRLNMSEAAAYRKQKEAINHLAIILQTREGQVRARHRLKLESRLEPPTYVQLIGVEDHLSNLLDLLITSSPPWLVSIEGLGGLGKTSLADALSRQGIDKNLFDDFGWVSARQQVFNPGGGIKSVNLPALTAEDLVEKLAVQLMPDIFNSAIMSVQDVLAGLRARLKQRSHLIVIDNLETVADIERLLPTLRNLVDPSKFLLTSRESLYHEPGLHHFSLPELSKANALRLIRYEARLHNLPYLETAADHELHKVFETVGGNPLALRLVVGQAHVHPLDVILSGLTAVQGQKAETLYTFIYRRAWDNLDEGTRLVFLSMPLVADPGGSLEYLVDVSGLDPATVSDALDRLMRLNLVDSQGDLSERRYTIHGLTRTFLQEQVVKWQ